MTENDLIKLYCIIDDFYKRFIKTEMGKSRSLKMYSDTLDLATRLQAKDILCRYAVRVCGLAAFLLSCVLVLWLLLLSFLPHGNLFLPKTSSK